MDEVRHRPQAGYSVGLKQKIKLAQALVHGPRLVFLDEPLNGLDPNSRDEMMGLLAGISRSGVALVISSHVLHDIESLCTEVLVLDCGRLLYSGPIDRLGRGEKGRYRARIRGDEGSFIRLVEEGGGRVGRKGHLLDITVPDTRGTALVFDAARQAACQVRELLPARDSLEDAFLRLLGREGQ
jgi:ABC-2 type transport system ATP-binding protein